MMGYLVLALLMFTVVLVQHREPLLLLVRGAALRPMQRHTRPVPEAPQEPLSPAGTPDPSTPQATAPAAPSVVSGSTWGAPSIPGQLLSDVRNFLAGHPKHARRGPGPFALAYAALLALGGQGTLSQVCEAYPGIPGEEHGEGYVLFLLGVLRQVEWVVRRGRRGTYTYHAIHRSASQSANPTIPTVIGNVIGEIRSQPIPCTESPLPMQEDSASTPIRDERTRIDSLPQQDSVVNTIFEPECEDDEIQITLDNVTAATPGWIEDPVVHRKRCNLRRAAGLKRSAKKLWPLTDRQLTREYGACADKLEGLIVAWLFPDADHRDAALHQAAAIRRQRATDEEAKKAASQQSEPAKPQPVLPQPTPAAEKAWKLVTARLESSMGPAEFGLWIRAIILLEVVWSGSVTTATMAAPNKFIRQHIERALLPRIVGELARVLGCEPGCEPTVRWNTDFEDNNA